MSTGISLELLQESTVRTGTSRVIKIDCRDGVGHVLFTKGSLVNSCIIA